MIKKLNKKGSLPDIIFIGVVLTVVAISILFGFKIISEFKTNIDTNDNIPTEAKTAVTSLQGNYSGVLDNTFLILLIGMMIAALILASLVRVHPIFIPFFWIALLFVIFICGVLSNIYQEMAATTQLSAQADQLTFITNILEYLPLIVGIFGHVLMIIMYKLWQNSEI